MADVIITHDEAESLYNHLESTILDEIRNDPDYDNLGYLANIMNIYAKCKNESESKEKGSPFSAVVNALYTKEE